ASRNRVYAIEALDEEKEEKPADGQNSAEVGQAEMRMMMEIGLDEPVNIDETHYQQPSRAYAHRQDVALNMPGHEIQKGNGEMAPGKQEADEFPAFAGAVAEEYRFFGNI